MPETRKATYDTIEFVSFLLNKIHRVDLTTYKNNEKKENFIYFELRRQRKSERPERVEVEKVESRQTSSRVPNPKRKVNDVRHYSVQFLYTAFRRSDAYDPFSFLFFSLSH